MRTKTSTKLFACTFACLFMLGNSLLAQTLTTDQADYSPGDVVILTGSGFASGETVTLQVLHADGTGGTDSIAAHQPWDVTANGDGNFSTTWVVFADGDEAWASLKATADGQTSGLHAEAFFTDGPDGTGVVTVTANGGSCLGFTAAQGNGPDNWEVAEGGSYTMTITGVTECEGSTITVFIQSSNTGNFCFNATGGAGSYSGDFSMPDPSCFTMPISYKCGADQPCNNDNTYNANGPSDNNKVHLRANIFEAGCSNPVEDEDCDVTCLCIPPTTFTVDSISPVSALICWDEVPCATGYIVAWARQGSNKWQYRTINGDHCTTFTNNYPTVYQIKVATICSTGDTSAYSDILIFQTYPSCLPPTDLYTDNISATQATGHWTPAADASKQNFWYRKVGDASFTRKAVSATTTSRIMKNLLPLTSYEWKVRSACSDETRSVNGAFSPLETFTTSTLRLSIDESTGSSFSIYPNPSSDGNFVIAMVVNSSIDHATITITNLLGKVIYQQEALVNSGVLSQQVKFGEGIPTGTYMVRIIAAETVYTTQLVYQQ